MPPLTNEIGTQHKLENLRGLLPLFLFSDSEFYCPYVILLLSLNAGFIISYIYDLTISSLTLRLSFQTELREITQ